MNNIDVAFARFENGIIGGIYELIYQSNVNTAKIIVETWARNVSQAMINYKDYYKPKVHTPNEPYMQESGTLLNAVKFVVDIYNNKKILIYLDFDDSIEPRTKESTITVFERLTYGVTTEKINIPARPVFYDILDGINIPKCLVLAWSNAKSKDFNRGFATGLNSGGRIPYYGNQKLIAKFADYKTGAIRWL